MVEIEEFYDIYSLTPYTVDKGYFIKNGFFSIINNTKCRCKTKKEHFDKCLTHTFKVLSL